MSDQNTSARIRALSDIDLVRMLTVSAPEHAPDVLAIAEAEANRRGVPIDEAFIPADNDDTAVAARQAVRMAEALRFQAGGTSVACAHCGSDRFESRTILLNTRGLTYLNLDWLNRSATALVCARCGYIALFALPPTAIDDGA